MAKNLFKSLFNSNKDKNALLKNTKLSPTNKLSEIVLIPSNSEDSSILQQQQQPMDLYNILLNYYSKKDEQNNIINHFMEKIGKLNNKFHSLTEKYVTTKESYGKLSDELFLNLFKQIDCYVEEIQRLNKKISTIDNKDNKLIIKNEEKEVVIKSDENIKKENIINTKQEENKDNEIKINEGNKEENNIQNNNEIKKQEETKGIKIVKNSIGKEIEDNEKIKDVKTGQNKETTTNIIPETNENIKSEPNEGVIHTIENKNSEREIVSSMSEPNVNINKKNLTPDKDNPKKSITKKYIKKINHNNYIKNLNNSAKVISTEGKQRYKTFLLKNKYRRKSNNNNSNSKNQDLNHNSQENIISINILNRIQEVKKSKTKNNFYKVSKKKNSIEVNNSNTTKSIHVKNRESSHNNKIIGKGNIITTPVIKNKKIELFKKNSTNRKLNNFKGYKPSEDLRPKYMSSFSIKVNRTYFKKDKNHNLKKALSKNVKKVVDQNETDLKKENKNCKK